MVHSWNDAEKRALLHKDDVQTHKEVHLLPKMLFLDLAMVLQVFSLEPIKLILISFMQFHILNNLKMLHICLYANVGYGLYGTNASLSTTECSYVMENVHCR